MNVASLTCALALGVCMSVFAQERAIFGRVTDKTSGDPLPGVNVVIKGAAIGAATDKNGQYKLTAPSDNAILVFTFIGFKTIERPVESGTSIDVVMEEDVVNLEEGIVVTGLGIEREKRSIGYGISELSSKDVTVARETNIVNTLQGKTTGVLITQTGGGVGGSTQILIRGMTSLSGNNNPLWVVDGVPIYNTQGTTGSRISGNRDFFNGASVVNPDDIASFSILKGAAATALYGSRAAAGVILVTTKKGSARADGLSRPQIAISSSTRFDWLFKTPNMQYEYSGGSGGKYDSSYVGSAWGVPIRGQEVTLPVVFKRGPLRAYKENYNQFYELGRTLINNVSVADASNKFDYRVSVTSLNRKGILPNSTLDRITVSLNAGVKHAKWMTSRFSVQYIRSDIPNTGVTGSNDPNVLTWNYFTPTTDIRWLRTWKNALGEQINRQGPARNSTENNPFWLRYENKNSDVNNRVIASLTQVFTPVEGLNITSRIGYDFERDKRIFVNSVGTIGAAEGSFTVDETTLRQLNWDGIVDYTRQIGDVTLKGLAGFQYNSRLGTGETLTSNNLDYPGALHPDYARAHTFGRSYSEVRLMGAYGNLDISYKNWLTLTLTGRNDWSSTLPKGSNSYFYPSASAAFVFTDAFRIASRGLSFGKLRASWAQVGNTTGPYALDFYYYPASSAWGQYSLSVFFPFSERLALDKTSTIPNNKLRSELQTSWEVGAELAFLDGRIGLDVAYYQSKNTSQIISRPIPESSGFTAASINSGKLTSSGIEASLRATILDMKGFRWHATINFSTNRVRVSELGTKQIGLASAFNSVQVVAIDGGSVELQAIGWERDPASGRPLIDPKSGRRIASQVKSFGTIFPLATWGLTNEFSIGNGITLSVTIDGRIGGKIQTGTVEGLWSGGFVAETTENRKGTFVDREGVIKDENGAVRDNDVPMRSTADFWGSINNNSIAEATIFDGTFIKLREIGLSYSFPKQWLSKTPFTGLRIGVEGRNLLLIYSKIPHIDPEANLFGAGSAGFGVELNGIPSSRSLGFNVELKF